MTDTLGLHDDRTGDEATCRALLTLAASEVGAEVLDGLPKDRAALRLGLLCRRRAGHLTLTYRGEDTRYSWPDEWARAVSDLAEMDAAGVSFRPGDSRPT